MERDRLRKLIGLIVVIGIVVFLFYRPEPFEKLAQTLKTSPAVQTVQNSQIPQRASELKQRVVETVSTPEFKVKSGARQEQGPCVSNPTGTQCERYVYAAIPFMTIQSANDYDLVLKEVMIDEKPRCSMQPNRKMNLGDTYDVPMPPYCDPINVLIVTDHGEATYTFRP
jgi:hypothetical protein